MYTKGNWSWKNGENGTEDLATLVSDSGEEICYFGNAEQYYSSSGSEPTDGDKKLIAAAPDLLEALQTLQTAIEYAAENNTLHVLGKQDIDLIDAAIFKATGE